MLLCHQIKRWVFVLFMCMPAFAMASKSEIYTGVFSNLALEGYDTVAYFDQNKPVEGKSDYSYKYKGALWQFSTEQNRQKFIASPESYAPQYGGYCAWLIARGDTAKGDPNYWSIENGKLYLNYNADIQQRWSADKAGFIKKADAMWPDVLN